MPNEMKKYSINDRIKGFVVKRVIEIAELQCVLVELIHEESGAQVVYIANDDPENVFCLSFRTLPESSNGVAHILEHTVLCGSEKFPIKDSFFAMTRRSLNTFMNAFTGQDFTCYPAASQVEKDFYNLLEVYLDAVFHPLLKELSFAQEGHRLEFAIPDDSNSALQYKGVVFNEMKGSLSSPTVRLLEAVNAALFPNTSYGYNSGGDPKEIPYLSYEELLDFHKKYYHPSRCLFFFYGNLPLEKHLEFIQEKILKNVQKKAPLPPIPKQSRFTKKVFKQLYYPIASDEESEDKTIIAFSWLTCSILDQLTVLALNILDIVLMDTDAAYLKKELLRSGLCKQAQSMMDSEINEVVYTLVLKGCSDLAIEPLQALIQNAFIRLVNDGIPQKKLDSALHQLELARSEIGSDQVPFGFSLFARSSLLKQHGGKAEDGLRIHSLFEELATKLRENPAFLREIIMDYFVNNHHHVEIMMSPSKDLAKIEQEEEKKNLQDVRASLTEDQIKKIIHRSKELIAFQEKEAESEQEKLNLLPKIGIVDVPKKARDFLLHRQTLGNLELFYHSTFTNNIGYVDLLFPVAYTKEEDLWLLHLFASLLGQVGSKERSYQESLEYMQENTGGVSSYISLTYQASDAKSFVPSFHIRGKALYPKMGKLFSLIFDMASDPNFTDKERLKELILKYYTNMHSAINQNALRYAINLSGSYLSQSGKIANEWYGLPFFHKIKDLAHNFDTRVDKLIENLMRIQKHLLCTASPHLIITCDQTELSKYIETGFEGLSDLPSQAHTPWKAEYHLDPPVNQGRIISSPVAFTSKVLKSVSFLDPTAPALSLAANLFENCCLHTRVREQGGAYGAGASSNLMSGNFYFYSYRDPNIVSTLQAFDEAAKKVADGDFDDTDLESAKLEMIQGLDSPVPPGSKAEIAYNWWAEGKTYEMRQEFRDAVLNMTCDQVTDAVKQDFLPHAQKAAIIAFADKDLLEKENAKLKSLNKTTLQIEKI